MRALRETKSKLQENKTKIFVRRGGPNHLEGLRYDKCFAKYVIFDKDDTISLFKFIDYHLMIQG